MNTEITNTVKATDKEAQYDTSAKRLLSHKSILAHILSKTVDDFKGMKPNDIVPYIVGNPYITKVSVEPGMTLEQISKIAKKDITEIEYILASETTLV